MRSLGSSWTTVNPTYYGGVAPYSLSGNPGHAWIGGGAMGAILHKRSPGN